MKVKFYTGKTTAEFDLTEPVSISDFRYVIDKPDPEDSDKIIKEETGDKFTIIMSNVPDDLRSDIVKMCRKYCNVE
jgi:hypothetical protein